MTAAIKVCPTVASLLSEHVISCMSTNYIAGYIKLVNRYMLAVTCMLCSLSANTSISC